MINFKSFHIDHNHLYYPETWNVINVINVPLIFVYYSNYIYTNNLSLDFLPTETPIFDYKSFPRHKELYTNPVQLNCGCTFETEVTQAIDYILTETICGFLTVCEISAKTSTIQNKER